MIESTFLPYLTTIFPIVCAITLLVLRAGASRVFFDIVGTYQADRLIKDQDAALTVYESLYLDTFNGIQEAAQEIGDQFTDLVDHLRPMTEEIEEARIQLEKFLDMAESDMKLVQQEIIDIGQAFAFAADEAMLAGAKMAQLSGVLGPGSVGAGTEIGMMFGLISGMETDAAMQRMVDKYLDELELVFNQKEIGEWRTEIGTGKANTDYFFSLVQSNIKQLTTEQLAKRIRQVIGD